MEVIGITGGVGAGKSEVLKFIESNWPCRIILSDRLAERLQQPGECCYKPLVELLGEEVLADRPKMAAKIFGNKELLEKVNEIVHPAVFKEFHRQVQEERQRGDIDYFFFESALIGDEQFKHLFDRLVFIYADVNTRINRLMKARGYSEDKCRGIINSQASDAKFREVCDAIIDNSSSFDKTIGQIKALLK